MKKVQFYFYWSWILRHFCICGLSKTVTRCKYMLHFTECPKFDTCVKKNRPNNIFYKYILYTSFLYSCSHIYQLPPGPQIRSIMQTRVRHPFRSFPLESRDITPVASGLLLLKWISALSPLAGDLIALIRVII